MAAESEVQRRAAGLLGAARAALEELSNDPTLCAYARLGWKELGNAFNLGHEGSVSQGMHEYGMPFSGATPGEIARQKAGGIHGYTDHEQEGAEAQGLVQAGRSAADRSGPEGAERQDLGRGR